VVKSGFYAVKPEFTRVLEHNAKRYSLFITENPRTRVPGFFLFYAFLMRLTPENILFNSNLFSKIQRFTDLPQNIAYGIEVYINVFLFF
jgi:hypothetical protein